MILTDADYTLAAMIEACVNDVQPAIVWCAISNKTDGKSLDDNIQAAIHAAEWLQEITKR